MLKITHALCAVLLAFSLAATANVSPRETDKNRFDPRDLSGIWGTNQFSREKLFEMAKNGDSGKCETCHTSDHTVPEPPLMLWARQHAIEQSTMAAVTNQGCASIGLPAQFWYVQLYPFEFVSTPNRIFQFFEKQNEWRSIWLNRAHPKNLVPSPMGDSVGTWSGNTLVIDTIGLSERNLIDPVGVQHRVSSVFHMVERWERVSENELDVELTYYDELAWGRVPWSGLKKTFNLQPATELQQSACSPEDNRKFDDRFLNPRVPDH